MCTRCGRKFTDASPDVQANAVDGMRKRLAELRDDPELIAYRLAACRATAQASARTERCSRSRAAGAAGGSMRSVPWGSGVVLP